MQFKAGINLRARTHVTILAMEAHASDPNQDGNVHEGPWTGPPTIRCLRGERRDAEAQRARALLELEDLQRAEQAHQKRKKMVRKWELRLIEREFKIDFKLKLAKETLRILTSPKSDGTKTPENSTQVDQTDQQILGILE